MLFLTDIYVDLFVLFNNSFVVFLATASRLTATVQSPVKYQHQDTTKVNVLR